MDATDIRFSLVSAKYLVHLLDWYALGFWHPEVHPNQKDDAKDCVWSVIASGNLELSHTKEEVEGTEGDALQHPWCNEGYHEVTKPIYRNGQADSLASNPGSEYF